MWRTKRSLRDPIARGTGRAVSLLPLDRAGGFGGDVVDDAVDAAHLVDDARCGAAEHLVRERVIVGGGIGTSG